MSSNPIEEAFIDVAYAESKPPEWVVSDVLPVGLTILSGPPKKAFKSLQTILLASLCARWPVRALPPWMRCVRGGPSLLLSYEADAGVIKHIIEKDLQLETEPGNLYIAHDPFKFQLDDPHTANQMLDYMDEKDPILVVMDPFRNMHSGDENDSGNVIGLLSPLVQWGHQHGASILMVHHVNKPAEGKDGSSFYAMRGSSALPGLADGLITIENTKEDGEIIINATFKRGQSYRRTIHLGVPGYGWGSVGYEVFDKDTKRVLETFNSGTKDKDAISVALKMNPGQVKQALIDLRRNGLANDYSSVITRGGTGHWDKNNIP